ncbi:group II intron reverse transcriptase/maturase, partial [Rhodococcus rhodochrous]|uniref:group II intron reverse transcriptase/maturase n=1 Tax=Rhodococcus rhodochrous TaxID=1829 RepID=UPI000A84D9C6
SANKGAPGVDGQSLEEFESDLRNNLYKIWNRMSSGSYHPQPVRAVAIPKGDGGQRMLGIPTVADRIAQAVVTNRLVPRVEQVFHPDSYGYRPGRSALDAVAMCTRRSRQRAWAVKIDLRAFFDTVGHELMVKALRRHVDPDAERWIMLYVQRWLRADMVHPGGERVRRDRGTPQGGVVSPVLANLFLHYAFDSWMAREHPGGWFERYADDIVVHSATERQAQRMVSVITGRMVEVGLEVHPDKTTVTYCRGGSHRGRFDRVTFDFLGYTFAPRPVRVKGGGLLTVFAPAVSRSALKEMGRRVRRWKLHRRVDLELREIARWINPIVRGWMQYYGRHNRSALFPLLRRINAYLMR